MHPLLPLMRDGLDPPDELALLRAQRPVAAFSMLDDRPAWLVTRHDDVRAVLGDAHTFSNDPGGHTVFEWWRPGGLGFHDPPAHTRRRRLLAPAFTGRSLRQLRSRIEAIVAGQLDRLERAGPPADLHADFALPVASAVVCELIGVPDSDMAHIGNRRFDFLGQLENWLDAIEASLHRIAEVVARQRVGPRAGLLGRLIREHGERLDDRELTGLMDGLLTGGQETTASMLTLGCLVLLGDGRAAAAVRDGDDIDRVVEELLRYVCVAQIAFPRFARREVVLRGERIAPGEPVFCSLPSANRDPALGPGLDRLDPWRPSTAHLAFGHGIHHCLGAPLARMEMRMVLPALLRRFPTLRLAVPAERIAFKRFSIVHGVESLPVAW